MALRMIRTDEDPVLRKKSRTVEVFDERLRMLADDMLDTMHAANGVGIAAVQIGILKRMFIVETEEGNPIIFVNPEIVAQQGLQCGLEGCLSIPDRNGEVERPEYVKVRYQDLDGKVCEAEGTELFARAVCHEYDHLDGILYTDRALKMYSGEDDIDEAAQEHIHHEGCGCGDPAHSSRSFGQNRKDRRARRRR